MKCPRCAEDLREVRFEDIVIDRCAKCCGVWFDFAELERILGRDTTVVRRFLPQADLPPVDPVETLPCPRCEDVLVRMYSEADGLAFYSCLTCYGRWLDGSELQRIVGRPLAVKFERLLQQLLD